MHVRCLRPVPMVVAALVMALEVVASAQTPASTETTVYTYNADGALTSQTTTVAQGSGTTVKTLYYTWDNFVPETGSGSTGTLQAANGNLVSIGSAPADDSAWSAHYDLLDRLVQVTNEEGRTALYQYHPDELLAASVNAESPSTDGLQHYYDQSRYPQVTNLYDRHTGALSSRHQRIRYLEDGTEQMLVRHRKDVDGVYDLTGETMSPYQYDPYGASGPEAADPGAMSGPLYSLSTNPYRYSHELRDPVSGADYLRARWYLPGSQTFVQRDPARNLNRYGYANGNPITNYDPSGRTAKAFLKGLETGLFSVFNTHPLHTVEGIAGVFTEKFWANPSQSVTFAIGLFVPVAFSVLAESSLLDIATKSFAATVINQSEVAAATAGVQYGVERGILHRRSADASFMLGQAFGGAFAGAGLSAVPGLATAVARAQVDTSEFDIAAEHFRKASAFETMLGKRLEQGEVGAFLIRRPLNEIPFYFGWANGRKLLLGSGLGYPAVWHESLVFADANLTILGFEATADGLQTERPAFARINNDDDTQVLGGYLGPRPMARPAQFLGKFKGDIASITSKLMGSSEFDSDGNLVEIPPFDAGVYDVVKNNCQHQARKVFRHVRGPD